MAKITLQCAGGEDRWARQRGQPEAPRGSAKDGGGVSFDNLKLVSRITLCSNECRRRPRPRRHRCPRRSRSRRCRHRLVAIAT